MPNLNINSLNSSQSIGWADALISRLAAGSIGTASRLTVSVNGAVSAPPMSLTGTWYTGGSATTTKPAYLIEPTGTTSTGWSTSGTGIGVNAASGFAGNLLDAQVAGASMTRLLSNGRLEILKTGVSTTNTTLALKIGTYNSGWFENNSILYGVINGVTVYAQDSTNFRFLSTMQFGFASGDPASNVLDVTIVRDAADTLALRRTTNAQAFRIYNTYTDASNYERFGIRYSSNEILLGSEKAGTGAARKLRLINDNNHLSLESNDRIVLAVGSNSITFSGDAEMRCNLSFPNNHSIGSLSNPAGNIHLKPSASITPTTTGAFTIEATSNTLITQKLKGSDGTVRSFTPMRNALTTEDAGFVNFVATADADAVSAISTLTTSGAVTHHIQVSINGIKAWIPCSTTDPS